MKQHNENERKETYLQEAEHKPPFSRQSKGLTDKVYRKTKRTSWKTWDREAKRGKIA